MWWQVQNIVVKLNTYRFIHNDEGNSSILFHFSISPNYISKKPRSSKRTAYVTRHQIQLTHDLNRTHDPNTQIYDSKGKLTNWYSKNILVLMEALRPIQNSFKHQSRSYLCIYFCKKAPSCSFDTDLNTPQKPIYSAASIKRNITRSNHQSRSYLLVLKNSQYSQEKTCDEVCL